MALCAYVAVQYEPGNAAISRKVLERLLCENGPTPILIEDWRCDRLSEIKWHAALHKSRACQAPDRLRWNAFCTGFWCILTAQGEIMAGIGDLSRKIRNRIDNTLCESFEKKARALPPGRYVSLCFDDFPQSAVTFAAPLIEQRGWRATWYVAGGFRGKTEPHFGAMFEDHDLARLSAYGHDFGSHTFDHMDCRESSAAEIHAQCARNDAFLSARGISQVRSFAYPFGAANVAAKRNLSASDMALRGVQPGLNRGTADLNMLKATGLQKDKGGLARAFKDLEALKHGDGWLILFTHDICTTPSDWGATPDEYDRLLAAIAASGAEVTTVGDMVDRIQGLTAENSAAA
jgi:peptidoglycan/xylan/chitin deacetylase (PgdA/CDA1 family)